MDILEIEKIIRNSLSEEQDATAKYLERINQRSISVQPCFLLL